MDCYCGCGQQTSLNYRGKTNRYVRGHCSRTADKYVMPESKLCTGCNQILPIEGFGRRKYKSRHHGTYLRPTSQCLLCQTARSREARKKNPTYWSQRYNKIKSTFPGIIHHRLSHWKSRDKKFNLTVEYLISLHEKQKGRCYYTGQLLNIFGGQGKPTPNSISLDRLDPNKGYTKENVVWCTFLVNSMKQNLTEDQFYTMIQDILVHKQLIQ